MIDTKFDFRTDTPTGKDPDKYSKTLKAYHQKLWSRELPNGEIMKLVESRDPYCYLTWKNFDFGSDSIIVELQYKKYKHILDQVADIVGDTESYYENLIRRSYTIGGMIIFPKHPNSMNQRRGTCGKISDRWDLTLECIRKYYIGEESPLSKVIENDKSFFDLFVDFKGYVDFFLLQDCVDDEYNVKFWLETPLFVSMPMPKDIDEYYRWIQSQLDFVEKRGKRIKDYCGIKD